MAIRRPKTAPTDESLRIRDRAARARKAQPPRDPTGEHHEACAEIAKATGRDVYEIVDCWDERASMRQYDGNADRESAERLAMDDVRAIFVAQKDMKL